MFDRSVVSEALKNCLSPVSKRGARSSDAIEQASLVSQLIHDIFGGEILKTRLKKGWHFYNRVDGKRFDFSGSDISKLSDDSQFEDIPSSPGETYCYFEEEEYSNFLMRFIWEFEEAVGLDKYKPAMPS